MLTYLDVPSDRPVGGAKGHLILIPSDVGVKRLDTLQGMAVNVRNDLSGHAAKHKIGVIEKAYAGDPDDDGAVPVYVEGYLYAKDFPDEVDDLRANKDELGFSYETTDTQVVDLDGAPKPTFKVVDCVFTGATILYKNKAAYTRTSLAAEGEGMDKEQFKALLAEAMSDMMKEPNEPNEPGESGEGGEDSSIATLVDMIKFFEEFKEAITSAGGYTSLSVYLNAAADNDKTIKAQAAKIDELTTRVSDLTTNLNASGEGANLTAEAAESLQTKVNDIETKLTAAAENLAKVEVLAPFAETLKAEAEAKQAYARKSKPMSLLAKAGFEENDELDLKAACKAIDEMESLTSVQKMALKMELSKKK